MFMVTKMARGGPSLSGMRTFGSVDECKDYVKRKLAGVWCRIWEVFPDQDPVLKSAQKAVSRPGGWTGYDWVDKS